jgi:hypothetical protein
MSLTLRDAQHLTWKTFKKFEKIDETRAANFGSEAELVKKAGVLSEKLGALKNSGSSADKEEIARLLSEQLFSLLVLAERHGVNLEESFLQAVDELILGFVS